MRVFLIAGEPSGDALGGALMEGLKTLVQDVQFDGVGGPLMEAQGLRSRFEMSELSVMGLIEILPKYRALKRRIAETAQAVIDTKPDVLITIDSPDFCLRVAKLVKAAAPTRIVHYVAPTVWAWRPKRAEKMAGLVDQLLALFPFEPDYFTPHGLRCDFVGHPIATAEQATVIDAAEFRYRVAPQAAPLVVALPGSRRSEVQRLAPVFGAALHQFHQDHPQLRVVVPTVATNLDLVRDLTRDWPGQPEVIDPGSGKLAAFRAADVALAASGTVSLELAATGTPMVIAYDGNWISRTIIMRMLQVDTVTLVNLVSDTRAVPEFIGANCKPGPIAESLADVLENPDAQTTAMELTMQRLGQYGEAPGLRAARAVLDGLG